MSGWRPIDTAPRDRSVLVSDPVSKFIYCARLRAGEHYEPQPWEIAWRCDSSGRFSNPTHWHPLPNPPEKGR